VENWLQQEEEAAKLHSAPAVLNPLPAIRGANHLGAAAAAADPAGDAAAPGGRKAHERLSSKDLFSLKGGATGEQATAVVKAKEACDRKEGGGTGGAGAHEEAEAGLACGRNCAGRHHRRGP